MSRHVKILSVILIALLAVAGCSKTPPPTVQQKTDFVVAMRAEPPNLDPHSHTTLAGFTVQQVVFDKLVTQDEAGNIQPSLAKSWEVIDELTIRFFLRDDVYFHNGEKLTAEDVRYSIERATQNRSSATLFSAFDGANTKIVDEYTVDIKVLYPFAPIYNYLASSRGDIVCKTAVEQMGAEKFGREPVGSGPFKVTNWITADRIELEAFDKYWGAKPAFNNLTYRIITEPANRAIELETGNVDAIFDVASNDMERLLNDDNLRVLQGPGYKTSYITFNSKKAPFNDIRVRQAFARPHHSQILVATSYCRLLWRYLGKQP